MEHSEEMRATAARLASLSSTHASLSARLEALDEELTAELQRYAQAALALGDIGYVMDAIAGLHKLRAPAITDKRIAVAFGLERAERVGLVSANWPLPGLSDHMQRSMLGKLRVALKLLIGQMPEGADRGPFAELTRDREV